ncbi:MAG: porin [Alphaproteobacteria bacterium]
MNKFLITLATIASMAISGVAYADAKISGFMQQLAGMGDDVDGGLTQKFTRFSFGADTTTDNGWTVGGSFAIEYGNLAAGGLSGYGPTGNSMYVTTDMGTLTIGGTTSAVTNTIPRVANMIPGAGHDGGYQFLFDAGSIAANGVNLAEAYYAQTALKVHLALPTVNGFSVKASYTPDLDESTAAGYY